MIIFIPRDENKSCIYKKHEFSFYYIFFCHFDGNFVIFIDLNIRRKYPYRKPVKILKICFTVVKISKYKTVSIKQTALFFLSFLKY